MPSCKSCTDAITCLECPINLIPPRTKVRDICECPSGYFDDKISVEC